VISEADQRELIVATANRDDYRERFIAHAAKGGKRKCTDLVGLVMFYGEKQHQLKHFPLTKIERQLRLEQIDHVARGLSPEPARSREGGRGHRRAATPLPILCT